MGKPREASNIVRADSIILAFLNQSTDGWPLRQFRWMFHWLSIKVKPSELASFDHGKYKDGQPNGNLMYCIREVIGQEGYFLSVKFRRKFRRKLLHKNKEPGLF